MVGRQSSEYGVEAGRLNRRAGKGAQNRDPKLVNTLQAAQIATSVALTVAYFKP